MINVSVKQMGILEDASCRNYVATVLQQEFPLIFRSLSSNLRSEFYGIVAQKLRLHGLSTKFSQRGFIKLATIFGTRFDEDSIICEPRRILENRDQSCVLRTVELFDWAVEFRNSVYGPKYEHYLAAMARVCEIDFQCLVQLDAPSKLISFGKSLFPTRSAWLTPVREQALLVTCRSHLNRIAPGMSDNLPLVAATYGCTFFLGATCLDDPLHDFIRTIICPGSASSARELTRYSVKRAKVEMRSFESGGANYVPW